MFLSFWVLDNFFHFSKNLGFWVLLVHPTVVLVLLSSSVERCFVSSKFLMDIILRHLKSLRGVFFMKERTNLHTIKLEFYIIFISEMV